MGETTRKERLTQRKQWIADAIDNQVKETAALGNLVAEAAAAVQAAATAVCGDLPLSEILEFMVKAEALNAALRDAEDALSRSNSCVRTHLRDLQREAGLWVDHG